MHNTAYLPLMLRLKGNYKSAVALGDDSLLQIFCIRSPYKLIKAFADFTRFRRDFAPYIVERG